MIKITQKLNDKISNRIAEKYQQRLAEYLYFTYPTLCDDLSASFKSKVADFTEQASKKGLTTENLTRAYAELLLLCDGDITKHSQQADIDNIVKNGRMSFAMKANALDQIITNTSADMGKENSDNPIYDSVVKDSNETREL